jgi:protein-tyrosine-phosphatase
MAVSAGFHPQAGRRTPDWLAESAREYKVDLSEHESRLVTRDEVESADAIFVMDQTNYRDVIVQFPKVKDRTYLLGLFADDEQSEIADPFNRGQESARGCCEQLVVSLEGLLRRVLRA